MKSPRDYTETMETNETLNSPLRLYYDGACHLCSREIEHYQKLNTGKLRFIDISHPGFERQQGFPSKKKLNKYFHVQLPSGEFVEGVDAFVEIWKRLPRYQWASKLAQNSLVHTAMSGGYKVFAEIRPLLPKKKRPACTNDHCPI
jgi:predicted DCC family thiol-disulfide oxidoreductase YuxK